MEKVIKEIKKGKKYVESNVKKVDQQGQIASQSELKQSKDDINLIFKT